MHFFRKLLPLLLLSVNSASALPILTDLKNMVTGECPGGDLGDSELPKWAEKQSPSSSNWSYYVGYATDANSIEEARNIAYKNALLEAAKREFPELIKISEYSTESLKNSAYQKNFDATEFAQISFAEIEHGATDSPYVLKSQKTNCKINAYVLLRWSPAKIALEKTRLKKLNQELTAGANESDAGVGDIEAGSGVLEIKTTPPKSQIIIDGEHIGLSNLILKKISVGKHQIMLQKPGYKIEERDVFIEEGKTQSVVFQLVKIESSITVTTTPPGASVFLNSKPFGVSDNVTGLLKIDKLSPGEYIPRIEKFDYEGVTGPKINLGDFGAQLELKSELSNGSATFLTNVPEVEVQCESKKYGKTPAKAPYLLKISQLKGGVAKCTFTKPGYNLVASTSEIRKSIKQTINVSLAPIAVEQKIENAASHTSMHDSVAQRAREMTESKVQSDTASSISGKTELRDSSYILSGLMLVVGGLYWIDSDASYSKYKNAKTSNEASKYRQETDVNDFKRNVSVSISALSFGLAYYLNNSIQNTASIENSSSQYSVDLKLNLNSNTPALMFAAHLNP